MIKFGDNRVGTPCQREHETYRYRQWYKAYITDNEELRANWYDNWYDNRVKYKNGFHIFTSLKAAKMFCSYLERGTVHKVKYRGAHTLGTNKADDGKYERCVVASEMMVLEEVVNKKRSKV